MAVAFNFEIHIRDELWTCGGCPLKGATCSFSHHFFSVLGIRTKNGSIVKGMTRKLDLLNEVASGSVTGVVNPKILASLQRSLSVHDRPTEKISSKKPVDAASKASKGLSPKR